MHHHIFQLRDPKRVNSKQSQPNPKADFIELAESSLKHLEFKYSSEFSSAK
jgi:hypothetical protein